MPPLTVTGAVTAVTLAAVPVPVTTMAVPVEVVEREAAGEDLSGGGGDSRGDRPREPRESRDRGDRGGDRDRGDRGGDRDGDGGHRRTRHRSRGNHE